MILEERSGLSQKEARWFVDRFFEGITQGLLQKKRVEIRGLGVFSLSEREQAIFTNPKNKKVYAGGKIQTVLFKPSKVDH